MKIAWFCIPAHGHTNPTLGLVKELTQAGHQVFYFSFEMFREKIEAAGARFIGCDGYDFEMEAKENADRVGKDKVFATELLVSSTLALDDMTTKMVEEIKLSKFEAIPMAQMLPATLYYASVLTIKNIAISQI